MARNYRLRPTSKGKWELLDKETANTRLLRSYSSIQEMIDTMPSQYPEAAAKYGPLLQSYLPPQPTVTYVQRPRPSSPVQQQVTPEPVSTPAPAKPVEAAPAPAPAAPAPETPEPLSDEEIGRLSSEEKSKAKSGGLSTPQYLGIDPQMTPLQARTRIATQATSGGLGQDEDAFSAYRSYAYQSLGAEDAPLPVEQKYIGSVWGKKIGTGRGAFHGALESIFRSFGGRVR